MEDGGLCVVPEFKLNVARILFAAGASGVAANLAITEAYAQTSPSQVTPESVRPEVAPNDSKVILPETRSTTAPEGAENLSVRVGHVIVDGADPRFGAQIAAIIDPYAGRTVRVSDLYRLAAQIEAIYARSGHVLTRATIPPQEIADGAMCVSGLSRALSSQWMQAPCRLPCAMRWRPEQPG